MTSRGFGLLLGVTVLVVGAAWLYWRTLPPPHDDPLRPLPTQGVSPTPQSAPFEWPDEAEHGESVRTASSAADPGAFGAASRPADKRLRVVVMYGGAPFRHPARIVFSRDFGTIPIDALGTTAVHDWPGDTSEIAVELGAGNWSVHAETAELVSAEGSAWLREKSDEVVRLELESPCRWLSWLVGADGRPAPNVAVRVVADGRVIGSARSAADGSFQLRALARPDAKLEVGDLAKASVELALPPDCRGSMSLDPIQLPPLASLTIEIDRVAHEHEPVQVHLQAFAGRSSVRAFAPGEPLRFDDLTPGRYRVFVYLPGLRGNAESKLGAGAQSITVPLRAWQRSTRR